MKKLISFQTGILYILPMLFVKAMGCTSADLLYKVMFVLSFGAALIAFAFHKESIGEKISRVLLFALFGITIWTSGNYTFLLLGALVLSLDTNVEDKVILQLLSTTWWIGVGMALLLLALGIRKDNIAMFGRSILNIVETKHTFGYSHANLFAATVCIGLLLIGTLIDHLDWKMTILFILLEGVTFWFTRGFTSLFVFGLFLLLKLITQNKFMISNRLSIAKWLGRACAFPPLTVFICLFGYQPRLGIWRELNIVLSGRIFLMTQSRIIYQLKPFGQRMLDGTAMQDMAYPHILYTFGWLIAFLLIAMYSIAVRRWVSSGRLDLIIMCLCFLVYGMAEQFFRNCFMNVSLIVVALETLRGISEVAEKWQRRKME